MAHLTCVGHTARAATSLLDEYGEAGIENILALGGDPPADPEAARRRPPLRRELVDARSAAGDFSIGVAAHPELHPAPRRPRGRPAPPGGQAATADFAITQFFFEADHYLRMVDELAALG